MSQKSPGPTAPRRVVVGSKNRVKINSVAQALRLTFPDIQFEVIGARNSVVFVYKISMESDICARNARGER
jgi:non-canonical (house-cleaning) NTP pyrophosphatase